MQEAEFSLLSCTGSFSPWSLTGWNERCFDLSANQLMASHKCFPVASLSAWGLLNTLHQEESHKVESNKNLTTDWKLYAKGHISFMKPTVEVKNTLKATTPPSLFPSSAPSPECKCTVQNSQLCPADSLYSKAIMGLASLSESSTPLPGTLQSVRELHRRAPGENLGLRPRFQHLLKLHRGQGQPCWSEGEGGMVFWSQTERSDTLHLPATQTGRTSALAGLYFRESHGSSGHKSTDCVACVCTCTSVCECLRTSLWKWNQLQLKDNMRQLLQCILLA